MITASEAKKISNQQISEDIKHKINRDITEAAERGQSRVKFCFPDDTENYLSNTIFNESEDLFASIKTMLEELGYNVKEVNQGTKNWFFGTRWNHYLEVSW